MKILKTLPELRDFIRRVRDDNKSIGFVPTMGALHDGHLSLIKKSIEDTDITISSIFVNPTQFNNSDDLKNYPRDIDKDIKMLSDTGCDAVFIPDEKTMYPEPDTRTFDFDGLDTVMEGKHRPGHFNGVAQVVSKLFDMVTPDKAFFGQKDFQQIAIIRKMVEKLSQDVEIVPCPIIRENDGLAMSSRNLLLTQEHRKSSPIIYSMLKYAKKQLLSGENIESIEKSVVSEIEKTGLLKVEYFEIVDEFSLKKIETYKKDNSVVACIAVWAGKVRLIDNIMITK